MRLAKCAPYCSENSIWTGGYIYIFFFSVFQPGAAFLAICCILELKSVFCVHFGARISHLRAHLAFGFWLLALAFGFGFTWLHLAYGSWLLAFGFWFWCHLALVLAVHFTWLLAFVGFWYCSLHITFHVIHCIYVYIFHVNCTKTTDIEYRSLYACCCKKITKPSL